MEFHHISSTKYLSFLDQNDCPPPKCGELSEYTESAHNEVEDLSSKYMNGSNVYDRCGHDTTHLLLLFIVILLVNVIGKYTTPTVSVGGLQHL